MSVFLVTVVVWSLALTYWAYIDYAEDRQVQRERARRNPPVEIEVITDERKREELHKFWCDE